MQKIYIALVDTPGLFAWMIRRVIKINYIHVVLSLDEEFTQAYSIGRRNPFLPLFAGFEKEDIYRIHRAFPTASYKVYAIGCTQQQKENIAFQLRECYRQRFRYHYCIIGLFYLLAGKPFYQKRHYTCSSFLARLLEEHHVLTFSKHFSLVTPRDFYELEKQEVIFEGSLRELCIQIDAQRLSHSWIHYGADSTGQNCDAYSALYYGGILP